MSSPIKIGSDINLEEGNEDMPTFTFKELGEEPQDVNIDDHLENEENEENEETNDLVEDDEETNDLVEDDLVEDDLVEDDLIEDDLVEDDLVEDDLDGEFTDEEENEEAEEKNENTKKKLGGKRSTKKITATEEPEIDYGIETDEDDDIELEKFENDTREEYLLNFHPESSAVDFDEVRSLCTVVRDKDGDIIDKFHTTIPYLTKYEKARILGLRAKQLNNNIRPTIDVPDYIIDSYRIAELELENKLIPFIIRRPLPNGQSEYWRLYDLLQLC
jgi:DNA-directed RNA polymerase subunit K/omega